MSDLHTVIGYEQYLEDAASNHTLLPNLDDENESTEGTPTKYKKRKGTSCNELRKGFEYEFRTMMWLIICSLRNSSIGSFYVSSNEDGYGCFDDIILRYNNKTDIDEAENKRCFIQTKIKKGKGNTINKGHINSVKGSFSARKYFSSLRDIQKNVATTNSNKNKNDTFIVFTNAKFDNFNNDFNNLEESDLDSTLCKDFNTGCIFSIKDDCSGKNNAIPVLLFSSQANLDQINCRIKEGIADIFKCSMIRAHYIFSTFYTKILPCSESPYFLTKGKAWRLLHESERIVCNHFKNENNDNMNMKLSSEVTPVEETQQYMKQAVKRTLSESDVESLSNFDSVEALTSLSKNMSTFKTESTCNRGQNVVRPSQMLNTYYTALWFSYNFHSNREFLLRKLFLPGFQTIRKEFDLILADGLKLHGAILENDIKEINRLVCDNVDVNFQDKGGRTPLHLVPFLSSHTDQKYVTQLLLKHGAYISIVDEVFKWNPLRYADSAHCWSTIALILNHGGSINDLHYTMRKGGADAMYWALDVGSRRFVQFLVENGVDVNQVITTDGKLPLHVAAQHGSLAIVKCLVENKASIDVCDLHGNRPLYLALLNGHKDISHYLQSKGALQLNQ